MAPSKAERAQCLADGVLLSGGKLLELEASPSLLWVSPIDPQAGDGCVRYVVAALGASALFFGASSLLVGLWEDDGLFVAALSLGMCVSILLFARHVWRHRGRSLAMRVDSEGVSAEEQFSGAPTRMYHYQWSEIQELAIQGAKGASWLQLVPVGSHMWSRRLEIHRTLSREEHVLSELKERLERLRP